MVTRNSFRLVLLMCAILGLFMTFGSAAAITDGDLDGNGHPAVVLLLMEVGGQPASRCSATLLSPTVVLTAGHCTNNFPDAPFYWHEGFYRIRCSERYQ